MEYLYFLLFGLGILLSLFTLFALSKNDFVLLRRGVMQKDIFDVTFVSFVAGFVVARIFYIFDTFQFGYFNPIQFFHLVLFPGLSLFGFIVGVMGVVVYFFIKRRALLRAIDLFATSMYWIFVAYVFFGFVVHNAELIRGAHLLLTAVLFVVFVHLYRHFSLKDGSGGVLAVMYICLSYFFLSFDVTRQILIFSLSFTQIFAVVVLLMSLIFFVIYQFFKKA